MLLVWSAYVLVRAFVWVFARVFISVFDWVLECVLDLLGVLWGCAAEILRRYGREGSFGDDYRSLFDMRGFCYDMEKSQ